MSKPISRRGFLRMTGSAAAIGVGSSILAACAASTVPTAAPGADATATTAPAVTQTGGGTLHYGFPQLTTYGDFMTPWHYAGTQDVYAFRLTYSGLIQWNNDFSGFINDLAESYEFSEDKLTCTFNLRKNAKWHDGTPVTSKDVLFTFRVIAHPNSLWTRVAELSLHIKGMTEYSKLEAETISGITAPDDYTVVFEKLTPSVTPFLNQIAQQVMIPEHILGTIPPEDWKDGGLKTTEWALTKPVGTGPFKVVEYVPDQYITFERNEDYYRPKAKLDRLIYHAYTNAQAQSAALESGECHVGTIPVTDYERFSKLEHMRILLNNGLSNHALFLNVTTLNQQVRQALWYALDRDAINQVNTQSLAPVPEVIFEYGNYGISPNAKRYTYDPDMAKQLLQEGNWDPNRQLILMIDQGQNTPTWEPMFALIRSNWEAAGVKVNQIVVSEAEYGEMERDPNGFDVLFSGQVWGADPSSALVYFGGDFTSTFINDTEGIEIIDQIGQSEDQEVLKQGVWQLQDRANENANIIPLNRVLGIYAINKKVQGDLRPIYALWTRNDWKWEEIWVKES